LERSEAPRTVDHRVAQPTRVFADPASLAPDGVVRLDHPDCADRLGHSSGQPAPSTTSLAGRPAQSRALGHCAESAEHRSRSGRERFADENALIPRSRSINDSRQRCDHANTRHTANRIGAEHLSVPSSIGWTDLSAVVLPAVEAVAVSAALRRGNKSLPDPADEVRRRDAVVEASVRQDTTPTRALTA